MKGMSQLRLSQRATKSKKTSLSSKVNEIMNGQSSCLLSPTLYHDGRDDTDKIIRVSQIVRAQLVHAVSSPVIVDTETETEEKKKAREILQAKLLCASTFAPKNLTSLTQLAIGGAARHMPNSDGVTLYPSLLTTNNDVQKASKMGEQFKNNVSGTDDGRIHSYPYKKNGPYTCPKCGRMFETSQRFAAHVSSSHYKYESKSEKKKRLMAKIKRRNLRIEWVGDGLTIVPDDAPTTAIAIANAGNNTKVVAPPPITVKVEADPAVQLQLAPPPGWDKLTATQGVKIKLEPFAT